MTQTASPIDPLLITIVLGTLAIGLPIFFVFAIRFLWDRHLNLGRSKELEKLIWQLHRIASAMEHQMNLSFPPVQPGTEEARDLAYLQKVSPQPAAVAPAVAAPASATPVLATPAPAIPKPSVASPAAATPAPAAQQPDTPAPAAEPAALPPLERRDPSVEAPRAGVNSMFGL
jgi:hypothetical protein